VLPEVISQLIIDDADKQLQHLACIILLSVQNAAAILYAIPAVTSSM